jgi:hypothetical protein
VARSPVIQLEAADNLGDAYDPLRHVYVPKEFLHGTNDPRNIILSCLPKQKWMHHRIELAAACANTGLIQLSVPATYQLDRIGYGWFPDGHAWLENNPCFIQAPGQWAID